MLYNPRDKREAMQNSLRVGDAVTFQIVTTYDGGASEGSAYNVTTGTGFIGLDPNRQTVGTCSAGCTTASIIDTNRTEATDFWKYVKLTHTNGTGQQYTTRVAGNTASVTTLTLQGLPAAPAVGDNYTLHGYPLKIFTAAGTSGNNGTLTMTGSDLTMYAGRREVHYLADHGTDAEWFEFEVNVEA